ncbi:MAG: hypothetical protein QNJ97_22815 [Myxococcota bacterium]|nr:hypothetical protein [Myxococcota bacterium]
MKRKSKWRQKPLQVSEWGVMERIDEMDDDGFFDAVLITDNEETIYVEFPGKKTRLQDYIRQRVQITGTLFERDGRLSIAAKRIKIIAPGEDDVGYFDDPHEDISRKTKDEFYNDLYNNDFDDLNDFLESFKSSRYSRGRGNSQNF